MKQSRRMSLVEACGHTAAGFLVGLAGQLVVFPFFGIAIHVAQNVAIAGIFTVISVVRGYVVRRFFEFACE